MKKQLIALRGPSNVGKSTALHFLYKLLVSDAIVKPLSYKSIGLKLDFVAIVKIEGYKVGLVNRGDNSAILKGLLDELVLKRCDVIVCAARTKGSFNNLLTSYYPPYRLVQVTKIPSKNAPHSVSNLSAAHSLASLVYIAIDA